MPVSTLMIKRDAHRSGAFNHVGAHAVTVFQAMRNVEAGFAARHLDSLLQNDHRHGSVDVVVAVDQDLLFGLDGGLDPRHGVAHSGEQQRIVQMPEIGREETPRRDGIARARGSAARWR